MYDNVYVGFWTNWSSDSFQRLHLTIPSIWGNIIISFLAIIVSTAAVNIWGILIFAVHQARADAAAHDVLYYQQQAALRNSRGYLPTLLQLSRIFWSWRGRKDKVFKRSFPLAALCLAYSILFFFAGLFSSRLVTFTDEVLVSSPVCGWIEIFPRIMQIGITWVPNEHQLQVSNALALAARTSYRRSATYVRACYMEQPGVYSSLCTTMKKQKLDSTLTMTSKCPFPGNVCAADTVVVDSGPIKSDLDLGLTTKEEDRLTIRRVSSAVPLRLDKYMTDWATPTPDLVPLGALPNEIYKVWYLGNSKVTGSNATFIFGNVSHFYNRQIYAIDAIVAFADENDTESDITPLPDLKPKDADLNIISLDNSAAYMTKVTDPWFRAENQSIDGQLNFWQSPIQFSFIAYIEQYQICSRTACTKLTGINSLAPNTTGSLGLSAYQQAIYDTLWNAAWGMKVKFAIGLLGGENLLAKDFLWTTLGNISPGLPNDQWITEVMNMHNISMALLQRRIIEYALPPQVPLQDNKTSSDYVVPTYTTEGKELCSRQRVRNAAYTTFSFARLIVVVLVAGVIIATNLILGKLVAWIQVRYGTGEAKRISWIEAEVLQLQRVAFEGRGIGPWTGTEEDVPIVLTSDQCFAGSKVFEKTESSALPQDEVTTAHDSVATYKASTG